MPPVEVQSATYGAFRECALAGACRARAEQQTFALLTSPLRKSPGHRPRRSCLARLTVGTVPRTWAPSNEACGQTWRTHAPMVRVRARLQANETRWQTGHRCQKLGARHLWAQQFRLASSVHSVRGKNVLGEIDSDGDNGQNPPFRMS